MEREKINNVPASFTMICLTEEQLESLLLRAVQKGMEIKKDEDDFVRMSEAKKILHIKADKTIYELEKKRLIRPYGSRPRLYKKSELINYLETIR